MSENGSVSAGCSEAYCDAPSRSVGLQLAEYQARLKLIAPLGCYNSSGYSQCMSENGSVSAGCSEAYCDAPSRSVGLQLVELLK